MGSEVPEWDLRVPLVGSEGTPVGSEGTASGV